MKRCPKCDADISDSPQDEDPDTGIVGGYYCDVCDFAVEEEPYEPDVDIDYNAKSFRETYIESWEEHQRLHKR